uniref:Uncharacterized protein n=1 Tax=Compsopogon caeruleus TaxID=31354 RepID=A0A7S1T5E1_9RHOD
MRRSRGRRVGTSWKEMTWVVVAEEDTLSWSRAVNLAVALTGSERVLVLDCNYVVSDRVTDQIPVQSGEFYTFREPDGTGELRILYGSWGDLWRVGGFDERIFGRMAAERKFLNFTSFSALKEHSISSLWVDKLGTDPEPLTAKERLWNAFDHEFLLMDHRPMVSHSEYQIRKVSQSIIGRVIEIDTVRIPITHLALPHDISGSLEDYRIALLLHDRFFVPWDIVENLSKLHQHRLVLRLLRRAHRLSPNSVPPILMLDACHGLGNRMRALGSALSFANQTDMELLVLWRMDVHVGTSFYDLFSGMIQGAEDVLVVLENFTLPWHSIRRGSERDVAWSHVDVYNYMEAEGGSKSAPVRHNSSRHIYIKSAYSIVAPGITKWRLDTQHLQRLSPSSSVQRLMDSVLSAAGGESSFSSFVGVHVRGRTLSEDIRGVNGSLEYGHEAARMIEYYRGQSQPAAFLEKMQELADRERASFFVASDSMSAIAEIRRHFPQILVLKRSCDERERLCLQEALADLCLLSKTRLILGSPWSSFSEVASRFGNVKLLLAGRDFRKSGWEISGKEA